MAQYYYFTENGEKVGPVDMDAIKALAAQGIISPETMIEHPDRIICPARYVHGLVFGTSILSEQPTVPVPPAEPNPCPKSAASAATTARRSIWFTVGEIGLNILLIIVLTFGFVAFFAGDMETAIGTVVGAIIGATIGTVIRASVRVSIRTTAIISGVGVTIGAAIGAGTVAGVETAYAIVVFTVVCGAIYVVSDWFDRSLNVTVHGDCAVRLM